MLYLRSPIGQTNCREVKRGIVFLVLELIVLVQELGFYIANQDIPTLLEGTTLLFRFVVVSGHLKLAGIQVCAVAVVSLPGEVSVVLEASGPIAVSWYQATTLVVKAAYRVEGSVPSSIVTGSIESSLQVRVPAPSVRETLSIQLTPVPRTRPIPIRVLEILLFFGERFFYIIARLDGGEL